MYVPLEQRPCETERLRRYGSDVSYAAVSHYRRTPDSLSSRLYLPVQLTSENPWERHQLRLTLPTIKGSHPDCNMISCETLASLLTQPLPGPLTRFRIIDCRYAYEYNGGAIRQAENVPCIDGVEHSFFPADDSGATTAIIFHCEFSSKRGPAAYRQLRRLDRKYKAQSYPELYYPEIYILQGGYRDFFAQFPQLCFPQDYVPMDKDTFRPDLHMEKRKKAHSTNQLFSSRHSQSFRSKSMVEFPTF